MFHIPACLAPTASRIAATTWVGIEFFWAKVGHGKSHHIVKARIVPGLREGRHIFTNMDFGGPLLVGGKEVLSQEEKAGLLYSSYLGKDVRHLLHCVSGEWVKANLTLTETQEIFTNIPHGSRIVLDEVQNIFPIGGYKSSPEGFFRFLTKCRHHDVDFCFISQNHTLVDKRIISTASDIVMIKNAGFMSSFFKKVYHLAHFQSIHDKKPYNTEKQMFDMDVFKLYKSADTLVKGKTRLIPSFLYFPLGVIALWAIVLLWRVPRSPWAQGKFYEKDQVQAVHQAAIAPPSGYVPISLKDAPVSRPSAVDDLMAKLAVLEQSTSPVGGLPLGDLLSEEEKPVVFYNGLSGRQPCFRMEEGQKVFISCKK